MDERQEWIKIAQQAMENAYTPYSGFSVGACLVTDEGKTYQGVNIENASYGLTNCAERTAIFKAVSKGERHFKQLVVSGKTSDPIAPCGACLQVIAEFCEPAMPVLLVGENDVTKETTFGELLPYSFSNKDL